MLIVISEKNPNSLQYLLLVKYRQDCHSANIRIVKSITPILIITLKEMYLIHIFVTLSYAIIWNKLALQHQLENFCLPGQQLKEH